MEYQILPIDKSNLKVGNISEEKTSRFLNGMIAEQAPESGKEVPENSQIDFTISQGLINTESAPIFSKTLNVYVRGFEKQKVKIVVIDNNGREVVFNETREPGNNVYQDINSVGKTTYQVYIDGNLVEELTIGDTEEE
jgi:serine/threonine-protein kinase